MAKFAELLEEIASAEPVISISPAGVNSLVRRFGNRVRQMGRWNVNTDGSLDIPVAVIREAASELSSQTLLDALTELKTESLAQLPESSAAALLIEKICETYQRHFRRMMSRYQDATDAAEASQLRDQLVHEIFGE
jgi:hypothetical protein